jgi:hypothetical protein
MSVRHADLDTGHKFNTHLFGQLKSRGRCGDRVMVSNGYRF